MSKADVLSTARCFPPNFTLIGTTCRPLSSKNPKNLPLRKCKIHSLLCSNSDGNLSDWLQGKVEWDGWDMSQIGSNVVQ